MSYQRWLSTGAGSDTQTAVAELAGRTEAIKWLCPQARSGQAMFLPPMTCLMVSLCLQIIVTPPTLSQ